MKCCSDFYVVLSTISGIHALTAQLKIHSEQGVLVRIRVRIRLKNAFSLFLLVIYCFNTPKGALLD